MQNNLLFGTAGTPHGTKKKGSVRGVEYVSEIGLDCMELEFVRGVRMKEDKAQSVNVTARNSSVALSVHAPYYINLNSAEQKKIDDSVERIYQSASIGSLCGAESIVFHPAYYHKDTSDRVYSRVHNLLNDLSSRLEEDDIPVVLRPETTGKGTQFGNLDEILSLSSEMEKVQPCIDFSHLHARTNGGMNSFDEFKSVLSKIEDILGKEGLNNMHAHVSGIEYNSKGERNHVNLEESDFNYMQLLQAFNEFEVGGLVICESPNLEEDALLLKNSYFSLD
ncbi:Xylose isomerase domain protein TIM barrel [Methanohalobium evestigatum Z-7303]|uniref:Xylose isomerase domain protein TIM barrel n=1 Tax=Methanohalobium evestigatum (strain ATCC BAA-1072 / DSM 3721 / NBRC 107634 / OCM 161 / Z-7303) TaxID=644295 RepID=D7EAL0_METEZ|nr:TIM barrel protein [Methanohalobium evestigatum]ADI75009.1 Xylose isomerase domain protein TIM barrel [Methanohalobium evestigatum Z-7303]